MINDTWSVNWTKFDGAIIGFHITGTKHGSSLPICEKTLTAQDNAEEVYAHALLMAAGPELIKACDEALNQLSRFANAPACDPVECHFDEDTARAIKSLYSAIAKGKGLL